MSTMQKLPSDRAHGVLRPCDRCGIIRNVKRVSATNLCRDCYVTLNATEREAWAA